MAPLNTKRGENNQFYFKVCLAYNYLKKNVHNKQPMEVVLILDYMYM